MISWGQPQVILRALEGPPWPPWLPEPNQERAGWPGLGHSPQLAPRAPRTLSPPASSLPSINQLWGPPECQPRAGCWGTDPALREHIRRGVGEATAPGPEVKDGQREGRQSRGAQAVVPWRVRGRGHMGFVLCPTSQCRALGGRGGCRGGRSRPGGREPRCALCSPARAPGCCRPCAWPHLDGAVAGLVRLSVRGGALAEALVVSGPEAVPSVVTERRSLVRRARGQPGRGGRAAVGCWPKQVQAASDPVRLGGAPTSSS